MAVTESEAPLLGGTIVEGGAVDFKGHPADPSKTGCWKSASFIIGVEMVERFIYYGISSNLIGYLTDSLGQSTATAAANVNAWTGTAALCPLFGAFVADSFLGRYRMIIVASLLYILGLGLLSMSATLHSVYYSNCNKSNSNNSKCSLPQLEILIFLSLYLVAFAQGCHKPCVQAFGADQFNEEDPRESIAKSSFFNWYNFSASIGVFIAFSAMSYIQENLGWELGIGLLWIIMCIALVFFLLGNRTYRFRVNGHERNPFMRICQVFVKTPPNWQVSPTVKHIEEESQPVVPENSNMRFLDKAFITRDGSEDEVICNQGDGDDPKAIVKLFPIWSACLAYAIVYAQGATLFTKQGATMDRYISSSIQIPAASLRSFVPLSIMILLPIYDQALVPIARAITMKPSGISMLQRIGTGLFVSCISMVTAALVERNRLATVSKYGLENKPDVIVPMSVWWLVPQYLLYGVSDVFTLVGLQEFFYSQFPKELRSVGVALYLSILGVGSFLSSFLISVIEKATGVHGQDSWFSNNLNRAHLDYFYWLLAGISAVSLVVYAAFARVYVYNRK